MRVGRNKAIAICASLVQPFPCETTPLPRTDESQKMAAAMEDSLQQSQEEKEASDVYKLPPPRLAQASIFCDGCLSATPAYH